MKTLYEKAGKRYVPVAEERAWDSFPAGCHLVVVAPGSISRRFNIAADNIGLAAAAVKLENKLATIIADASKARPQQRQELTPSQRKAWEQLNKAMGGMAYIEYPSSSEIAQKVLDIVQAECNNKTDK